MHQDNGLNVLTFNAAAATDLSGNANLGLVAVMDAAGDAVLAGAGATGLDVAGIIVDGGRAAGDPITVVALGSCLGRGGAAINEGEYLTTDATAELVAVGAANVICCAEALQVGADAALFWVLVIRMQSTDGSA